MIFLSLRNIVWRQLLQLFIINEFPVGHLVRMKNFDEVGKHFVGAHDAGFPDWIARINFLL